MMAGNQPGASTRTATGHAEGANLLLLLCPCRWASGPSRSLWTARATRWGASSPTWPGCSECPHVPDGGDAVGACKQALQDALACTDACSTAAAFRRSVACRWLTWRHARPCSTPQPPHRAGRLHHGAPGVPPHQHAAAGGHARDTWFGLSWSHDLQCGGQGCPATEPEAASRTGAHAHPCSPWSTTPVASPHSRQA